MTTERGPQGCGEELTNPVPILCGAAVSGDDQGCCEAKTIGTILVPEFWTLLAAWGGHMTQLWPMVCKQRHARGGG